LDHVNSWTEDVVLNSARKESGRLSATDVIEIKPTPYVAEGVPLTDASTTEGPWADVIEIHKILWQPSAQLFKAELPLGAVQLSRVGVTWSLTLLRSGLKPSQSFGWGVRDRPLLRRQKGPSILLAPES
jgi:hypothetical protein